MNKTALILICLTILTKIIGFAREIVLSYFYGTSNVSDAYLISLTIPNVVFAFIVASIKTAYIPMYSNILNEKDQESADKFTNNIVNLLFIISTILIIVVLIFTTSIVRLFASGFEGDTLNLAVLLTRISIFSIYFIGTIYIFQGYLQLKKDFIIPALVVLPLNFFLILSIPLSTIFDVRILAVGKVVATIAQLLLLIPFLIKKKYKFSFMLDIRDNNLKKVMYLTLPIILGTSVNQINKLVDRTIASQVAIGGISALNYANRLNGFIQEIFVLSIATVMYPMISKMASEHNISELKKSVLEAIAGVNLLVVPAAVGSMIFAKPVVKLLFGRGAFDVKAISMTSDALFFYSIGMVGIGLREIFSKPFYALQDTKTPMVNAAIGMVLNIILNIILSKYLGISGLALATSIAAIVTAILMFITLRKKIGALGIKKIGISFLKILFASLIMGIISKFSFNNLTAIINQNISLLIAIAIGTLSYFVIIYFMNIEYVDLIVLDIKRKFKK